MPKLNARQEAFCLAYLRCLNATEAAREAGYSARTARQMAGENLTKPAVRERIEALKASRFSKAAMAAEEVLEELSLLGRMDMLDFVTVSGDGSVRIKPLDQLPPGASRAIQ